MLSVDTRPRSVRKLSGLRSTTRRGDAPTHMGPIEGPLSIMVWYAWSFGCSLSLEGGR